MTVFELSMVGLTTLVVLFTFGLLIVAMLSNQKNKPL